MSTSMSFRIRRARQAAGWSQAELARRVGVNRSAVTQWEHSAGTVPSTDNLARIAAETGVCFEWLATGRGPSHPEPGAFDAALIVHDIARDEWESRILSGLRKVSPRKRVALAQLIEVLAG
jgi:transcriptional regulator with XRE-family HTH domain